MSLINQNFTKNTLAAAVLIAIGAPTTIQALEITAEVSGTTNGIAFTTVTDTALSGTVDVLGNIPNVFYHVYGSDTGNFGSRVSGNRVYDVTGVFSYSDTITNTTGAAQSYGFDFEIIPGEISLSGTPFATSGDFLLAEYSIDILVNGTSIWDSSAKVEVDDTSAGIATFTYGGTSLSGSETNTASFSSYMWGSFIDTIALGTLGDNESLDFEYILTTRAAGDMSAGSCFFGDRQAGFDGFDGVEGSDGAEGDCGSIARSGDPFTFGGSSPNLSSISMTPVTQPTNGVPEPGSLALLGLGLAGVAAMRRRKNKTQ